MKSVICKYCLQAFSTFGELKGHFYSHKNISPTEKNKELKVIKKFCEEYVLKNPNKASLLRKTKKQKKGSRLKVKEQQYKIIEILGNRSVKYEELTKCSSCNIPHNSVWRFANTSIGVAYLCSQCKDRILKPLKWTSIVYNSLETNRRKH